MAILVLVGLLTQGASPYGGGSILLKVERSKRQKDASTTASKRKSLACVGVPDRVNIGKIWKVAEVDFTSAHCSLSQVPTVCADASWVVGAIELSASDLCASGRMPVLPL